MYGGITMDHISADSVINGLGLQTPLDLSRSKDMSGVSSEFSRATARLTLSSTRKIMQLLVSLRNQK